MLVALKQVGKHYTMGRVSVCALDQVNLAVEKGEFISIWGPSGSGKSTLLNLIGAVDTPSAGTILLEGRDLGALSDNARTELRNRFIGFIFQRYNLIPVLSAVENVMLPLQIQGVASATARRKALERLESVGLEGVSRHRPDRMSGGQQQRVAVARALITDPPLVIADEPTANLDSETARSLIALMHAINRQQGTTFIFSTHDRRLLDQVQRRILLKDGRIDSSKEAS